MFEDHIRRIESSPNPYAALGGYASAVVSLGARHRNFEKEVERFRAIVEEHALEDGIQVETCYVLRLMESKELIFEEIAKVFSLLEEIGCFECLGFHLPDAKKQELKRAFKGWISLYPKNTYVVAKECVRDKTNDLWFYRAALGSGTIGDA